LDVSAERAPAMGVADVAAPEPPPETCRSSARSSTPPPPERTPFGGAGAQIGVADVGAAETAHDRRELARLSAWSRPLLKNGEGDRWSSGEPAED